MTGGIINVITKSGGNMFRGSVFGFSEGGALMRNDSTANQRPQTTTTVADLDSQWDVGAEARRLHRQGQAVVLRRLQPRAGADRDDVIRDAAGAGAPTIGSESHGRRRTRPVLGQGDRPARQQPAARVLRQRRPDHARRQPVRHRRTRVDLTGVQKTGSTDPVVTYEGTFGPTFTIRALAGRHNEKSELDGPGKTIPGSIDADGLAEHRAPAATAPTSRTRSSRAISTGRRDQVPGIARAQGGRRLGAAGQLDRSLPGRRRDHQLQADQRRRHLLPPPVLRRTTGRPASSRDVPST